jgi:hypothetical protein
VLMRFGLGAEPEAIATGSSNPCTGLTTQTILDHAD